jgi:hypothetical protein
MTTTCEVNRSSVDEKLSEDTSGLVTYERDVEVT